MNASLSFLTALPFALILLAIAVLPLAASHFWESNKNKALVSFLLAVPVFIWLFQYEPMAIVHTLHEYASFICLLGSLFIITGGISIRGDLRATPLVNTSFLIVGAILANFVGTTGASTLLIRPFLKTNSERNHVGHLPVFFIFIVSNCGGLLTPLGDPPLFLGYLRGVPFFWTLKLFPYWATMIGSLLTLFFIWDSLFYRREVQQDIQLDTTKIQPLAFEGKRNFAFLAGVIGAVFLPSPFREIAMVVMTILSLKFGPKNARIQNEFSWGPIFEVAILFAGIFITMVPALMILKELGPTLGVSKPWHFFWATGGLSGVLDNAPTYLTFLSLAQGLGLPPEIEGVPQKMLEAISVGAVFMGANTYIGNGPNFMVKAIADHAGFKTPSFFGYMAYSICILFPLYGLLQWLFF
jgi:Na+/H+ antiporter NhaD/arsenite permease-like protein